MNAIVHTRTHTDSHIRGEGGSSRQDRDRHRTGRMPPSALVPPRVAPFLEVDYRGSGSAAPHQEQTSLSLIITLHDQKLNPTRFSSQATTPQRAVGLLVDQLTEPPTTLRHPPSRPPHDIETGIRSPQRSRRVVKTCPRGLAVTLSYLQCLPRNLMVAIIGCPSPSANST